MTLEITLSIAAVAGLVLLALVARRHRASSAPLRSKDIKELWPGVGVELFILVLAALATIAATIVALL